jgi:hypothetical protein
MSSWIPSISQAHRLVRVLEARKHPQKHAVNPRSITLLASFLLNAQFYKMLLTFPDVESFGHQQGDHDLLGNLFNQWDWAYEVQSLLWDSFRDDSEHSNRIEAYDWNLHNLGHFPGYSSVYLEFLNSWTTTKIFWKISLIVTSLKWILYLVLTICRTGNF